MKKIFTVLFSVALSLSTIAQNVTYSTDKVNEAKLNGVFEFGFDSHFTLDKLTKASDYYTKHFKAEYTQTADGFSATFTMLSDDPLARRVLERYFSTLGVKGISIDGSAMQVRPFLEKFIMLPKE